MPRLPHDFFLILKSLNTVAFKEMLALINFLENYAPLTVARDE